MSDSGLPACPAWFRHQRAGTAFLGAVDPTGEVPRWCDLGPLDVVALLRAGGLRKGDLDARIASATVMAPPERFLTPVPRGGKILCREANYRMAHAGVHGDSRVEANQCLQTVFCEMHCRFRVSADLAKRR